MGKDIMSVKQVAFEIPPIIQNGIDNGTLIRYGGIVRDQAGKIVKHLDEVPIPKADSNAQQNSIISFAKNNKYLLIGTVLVTAIAAGITYVVVKNRKNQEVKIPKCVADFNKSFILYIDSIKNGTVTEKKIDRVMAALDEIKKHQDNGNIQITLSIENVSLLLDMVRDYTIKFAEANSFKMPEDISDSENVIYNLQHYLKIQKDVFEKCA